MNVRGEGDVAAGDAERLYRGDEMCAGPRRTTEIWAAPRESDEVCQAASGAWQKRWT